jgi:hypothetical protein
MPLAGLLGEGIDTRKLVGWKHCMLETELVNICACHVMIWACRILTGKKCLATWHWVCMMPPLVCLVFNIFTEVCRLFEGE